MENQVKLTQQFALMGVMWFILGVLGTLFVREPEIVYVPATNTVIETKLVKTYVPTNPERECLAQALYAEARGEIVEGKLGVGSVIANRVADYRYPDTICGVVEYKTVRKGVTTYHFSYQDKGDDNFYKTARVFANMRVSATELKARNEAYQVADKILAGENILPADSLNYHSTKVNPPWSKVLKKHTQIGLHIFYRGY